MKIKKSHFFQTIFFLTYLICFNSFGTKVFAFTPSSEAECTAAGGYCGASCDAEDRVAVGTCGSTGANRTCCYPKTPSESTCTSVTCEGSSDKGTCSSNFSCPSGKTPFGLCGDTAYCCVPTSCKAIIPNPPGVETNPTNVSSTKDCESLQCGDGSVGKCIDSAASCSILGNKKSVGTCDGPNTQCCAAYNCSTTPIPSSTSTTTNSTTASLTYNTLENLPGFESLEKREIEGCGSDMFCKYLKALYLLALWIVGICALFMLVIGGFLYLSSAGNTALIGSAKKTITGALIGLVIALITWLILNTINPSLTTVNLNSLSLAGGSSSGGSTGGSTTPASGDVDKAGCEALSNNGAKSQCGLASKELVQVLSCMREKGVTAAITSISASNIGSDQSAAAACCGDSRPSSCKHNDKTCHYGCTFGTKGLSYAVDVAASGDLCKIADAAHECGAGQIWGPKNISCSSNKGLCSNRYTNGKSYSICLEDGHDTHLHISTAGCNH